MIVIRFDPDTNKVKSFETSGEASPDSSTLVFHDQNTKSDVLNTLYELAKTAQLKYLVIDQDVPREMTQEEKDVVDQAEADALKQSEITRIQNLEITPLELVKGLARLAIIPDEQAFIEEIKKYRQVDA